MKIFSTIVLFSVSSVFTSGTLFGAVSTFDFEGTSVPSAFSLTGQAGAFSQSITSTNAYSGSQALKLSLTCDGVSQWTQTTIVLPDVVQHVSFAIYDEFAGSSPVYYFSLLGDSSDSSTLTNGLMFLDYGSPGVVHLLREKITSTTLRTVGWHTMDALIGSNSIEYRMDGNLIGSVEFSPTQRFDHIVFHLSNAGNQGTNSLLIDNLSITTIPEPSSSLLGLLSVCSLVLRRIRPNK